MVDGDDPRRRDLEYLEPGQAELERLSRSTRPFYDVGWGSDGRRVLGSIPVAPCSRCGKRFAMDLTRDSFGRPVEDYEFSSEDERSPVCEQCRKDELDQDTLRLLEQRLGLTEANKPALDALSLLIRYPDRILRVDHLHDRVDEIERRTQDRVDELERRLEDRMVTLRSETETKLDGAATRIFNSSLALNILLFVFGVVLGGVTGFLLSIITG